MNNHVIPEITFKGNDILLATFLRRYLDKAKRVPGYENQVKVYRRSNRGYKSCI